MNPPALLLALLCLILALPVRAATLAEALEQAWARHPQAAGLAELEAAARAGEALAGGLTPGPAALSVAHLNDAPASGRGKREWEVELALPLWLPGQKAARGAEAGAARVELTARVRVQRLALAGELRATWWTLAAARLAGDLARRHLHSARALAADVERRWRAGDLARTDANLARDEVLAAQAELLAREAEVARAEAAWRGLTGNVPPAALDAEDPGRAVAGPDHPALDALNQAARLAHARLKLAGETRRDAPELALRWQRERGGGGEPYGNALGVKLSLPFSSPARLTRDTAAARAEARQADADLARAHQSLTLEAEGTRRDLAAAEEQLALTRQRLALLADNLALAEKAFALGEADLASLLRARAAAQEAEARLAREGVARAAAVSRLLQSLGVMP